MKNTMKKFLALLLAVLMTAALTATAFADGTGVSGDGTGNVSTTKSLDYKITKNDVYTDISGVKLEWSVPVLQYVDKAVRTWDTTNLKWVASAELENTADVSFTLTNRGSYPVKANVSFAKDTALGDADVSVTYGEEQDDPNSTTEPKAKITVNGNDPTLASIVNADEKRTLKVEKGDKTDEAFATAKSSYVSENCKATIVGKVTADLSAETIATSGTLGTYTVTISDPNKQEPAALAPGFYDANDKLVVSWADSGIDVSTDYQDDYDDENTNLGTSAATGKAVMKKHSTAVKVVIPDTVTKIGNYAFSSCANLTNVVIPDSVKSIGDYAFEYCANLSNVVIPNSITSIGEYVFCGTKLTSAIIPNSVTSMGECCFDNCQEMTSIVIGDNVTAIGDGTFNNCIKLGSVTIGSKVASIGDNVFSNCIALQNIEIPVNVTSIGSNAFADCSNLVSITYSGTTAQWNGISIVNTPDWAAWNYNCAKLTTVTCTDGSVAITPVTD